MTASHTASAASAKAAAADGYRCLLVHVQPGAAGAPRLAAAVELARKLDATLFGVAAETLQMSAYADPGGLATGDLLVAARQVVLDDLDHAEANFRKAATGLNTHWVSAENLPGDVIPLLARAADLIVAGGAPVSDTDAYRVADAGDLVLKSGRPVLVVPPEGGKLKGEAILVAWKDTREARRAVADAMPFLRAAKKVGVLEVYENDDEADNAQIRAAAVAAHLKRHGVAAEASTAKAPHDQTPQTIEASAKALGADLIVTGGYGHSRVGELVFGGVTRDLLRHATHFVLMSH